MSSYICCKCRRIVEVPNMMVLSEAQKLAIRMQVCSDCLDVNTDRKGRL